MMSKFWFLTGNSFKKKIKSKWFLVINILILAVLVILVNIDSIIKAFGGDFDDSYKITVVDNTGYTLDAFKNNIDAYNEKLGTEYEFEIDTSNKNEEELTKEIENTDRVVVVFNKSINNYIDVKLISDSTINTAYYQFLYQALTGTKATVGVKLSKIDPVELAKLSAPLEIDRVILDENKTSTDENMEMVMGGVFPTIILPVFILVILLVQMIGTEINEEKQTRSMEVIISNVSPKVHFFSKMIASNAFVLLQGLLLILYGGIALLIKHLLGPTDMSGFTKNIVDVWNQLVESGFVDKLYYIIPLTLVLMVFSFIAYSLVAGILASMTVNMEDYQQIQTPIMLVLLLGYYLAIMAGMFEGSILIRIVSYIPFISCLLSPALLVIGQVGIVDVLIAIFMLVLFIGILIKYGLRIYKIGILNYSTDKMWKKIFTAVKNKES